MATIGEKLSVKVNSEGIPQKEFKYKSNNVGDIKEMVKRSDLINEYTKSAEVVDLNTILPKTWLSSACRCIDGRNSNGEAPDFQFPGGGYGFKTLTSAVTNVLFNTSKIEGKIDVNEKEIFDGEGKKSDFVDDVLESFTEKKGTYYLHTDSHAKHEGEGKIGCGHLNVASQDRNLLDYFLTKEDADLIKSDLGKAEESDRKDPRNHKGKDISGAKYEVLGGEHQEEAIFWIKDNTTPGEENDGKILSMDNQVNGKMAFVYNEKSTRFIINKIVDKYIENLQSRNLLEKVNKTIKIGKTTIELEKSDYKTFFRKVFYEMATQHVVTTASRLNSSSKLLEEKKLYDIEVKDKEVVDVSNNKKNPKKNQSKD